MYGRDKRKLMTFFKQLKFTKNKHGRDKIVLCVVLNHDLYKTRYILIMFLNFVSFSSGNDIYSDFQILNVPII